MHLRFLIRCFCANQLGYVFSRLHQSFYNRRRISLVGFLQGYRQYRPGLHIHGMLGFVRQMRPIIFHLRNPHISIFAAVGLGLLPAYWLFWQPPLLPEYAWESSS
jgi:hypothetical protein